MPCHLVYFENSGYFNSLGYVKNMGVNLDLNKIFDKIISNQDVVRLKDAIEKAKQDSKEGKLPGIVSLIQLVEDLQDKYGNPNDHIHTTEAIIEAMLDNPKLVEYYGLEKLAHEYQHKHSHPHEHKTIVPVKKTPRYGSAK